MVGDQPQIDVQRATALGQRQHVVTAWQGFVGLCQGIAGGDFFDQFLIVEHVQVQPGHIGRKHPQDLFVFVRHQPETQPQRFSRLSGFELIEFNGTELSCESR